jgi:hypothetical protein
MEAQVELACPVNQTQALSTERRQPIPHGHPRSLAEKEEGLKRGGSKKALLT